MKAFDDWCGAVLNCIRFKADHAAIRKELTNHYEDHVKDLQRIGYDENLAKTRALAAMGDAEEVGWGLDKAHKPWLGWAWRISRALVLVLAVLFCWNGYVGQWSNIENDLRSMTRAADRYRDYGYLGASEEKRDQYELVGEVYSAREWERCGYTISIPYAAIWTRPMHDGTPIYYLTAALVTEDRVLFDEGMDLSGLTITSDWGKTWYAGGNLKFSSGHVSHFSHTTLSSTPFRDTRILTACLNEIPTRWLEFTYPYGEGWSVRLEWKEEIYQ